MIGFDKAHTEYGKLNIFGQIKLENNLNGDFGNKIPTQNNL